VCYGQSYSDRVDIHVLTELNSGAMVNVYSDCIDIQVLTELNSGALVRVILIVLIYTYINTITITLTIAPEFSSVKTCISTRSL
jgi:hypothetical protein